MNLDVFKEQWIETIKAEDSQIKEKDGLMAHIKKVQRKTIISNVMISVSFVVTSFVLTYIRSGMENRSAFFYVGIDFILLLLIVSLIVFWSRILFWKNPLNLNSVEFLIQLEKKFRLRQSILNVFIPIYFIALALGINLYYVDILAGAENILKISVYTITNIFFLVTYWVGNRFHKAKENALTEPIKNRIEQMKQELFST